MKDALAGAAEAASLAEQQEAELTTLRRAMESSKALSVKYSAAVALTAALEGDVGVDPCP